MMALNIAVPLTTVADLMDGFGLLSPISPLSVDCRAAVVAASECHDKKQLISPVGSESSGVSSLDSDEVKKPTSPPTTPTEEVEQGPTASSPIPLSSTVMSEATVKIPSTKSSSCSSTRSSLSSTDSISSSSESGSSSEESSTATEEDLTIEQQQEELPAKPKDIKVMVGGRNVLDLIDNLTTPNHFRLQFAQLPENDNIHFFLDNRSQYHRLGANGHIQEYTMVKCKCCDFRYPVNGTSLTSGGPTASMGQQNLTATLIQQQNQQQQQQQHFQWNSFANNFNSIANNKDKLSLSAAAHAFNKTFGSGHNNNSSNNNGSQYFRNGGNNGNIASGMFGRDSNRNSGGNLFNNSTSTYNNHKSYQQNYGASNNHNGNKFNNHYGNYPHQQQQQYYSKNQQMRYGNGNNQSNGTGCGFNASTAVAAAAALASQNLLNFNSFNNSNNFNSKNNMFAYYKTMM